jgi:hypothetical protein
MSEKNTCIAIYTCLENVEAALKKLQTGGLDLGYVSVLGKGFHHEAHPIGFYQDHQHIRYIGNQGPFWENLWNCLAGASLIWAPDFGPLVTAGPITRLFIEGLGDIHIGGGFSLPGSALFSLGVPRNYIQHYEDAVLDEKLLLLVTGTRQEIELACKIIHSKTQQVTVHAA